MEIFSYITHSDHIQDLFNAQHRFETLRPYNNITVRVNPSGKTLISAVSMCDFQLISLPFFIFNRCSILQIHTDFILKPLQPNKIMDTFYDRSHLKL